MNWRRRRKFRLHSTSSTHTPTVMPTVCPITRNRPTTSKCDYMYFEYSPLPLRMYSTRCPMQMPPISRLGVESVQWAVQWRWRVEVDVNSR